MCNRKKSAIFFLFIILCSSLYGQKDIWVQNDSGKCILNIDKKIIGKDMFFASRVAEISSIKHIAAGQTFLNPILFNFNFNGNQLSLIKLDPEITANEDAKRLLQANQLPAIWKSLNAEQIGEIIKVDIGTFLSKEQNDLLPLPSGFKTGELVCFDSGVMSYDNLPDRVNIKVKYSYSGKYPFSTIINYTIMIAPPIANLREWDERIGVNYIYKTIYNLNNKIERKRFVTRWRIEPKQNEIKRYLKGELVEPESPIVIYIDNKIPPLLYDNIRLGVLDWNHAFEAIGFKNAIQVKNITSKNNNCDILFSAFRYVPTNKENAMGVNTYDPRTGEIIQGDIIWYHNVIKLLNDWRFIQTAAVDPNARGAYLSDNITGELIRYAAAHEMGHILGFVHNMRASYAYPTDSLRSSSFTKTYGTTASIMDYARNNFVAQPEDYKKGVKLTPPHLGPYDYLSVEWLYKPLYDKNGNYLPLDKQKELLNKLLVNKGKNILYQYARKETAAITSNPAAQPDILGDDIIKSAEYGINNLKLIADNLFEWSGAKEIGYQRMEEMYNLMIKQFFKYLNCAAAYIGGVEYLPYSVDDSCCTRYLLTDSTKALQATRFIITKLVELQAWAKTKDIEQRIGPKSAYLLSEQKKFLGEILSNGFMSRLQNGMATITQADYYKEIEKVFKKEYPPAIKTSIKLLQAEYNRLKNKSTTFNIITEP